MSARKPRKWTLRIFAGYPYKNQFRDWFYWDLKHSNGRIIADGSEAYTSPANIRRAVKSLPLDWSRITIIDETRKQ